MIIADSRLRHFKNNVIARDCEQLMMRPAGPAAF